MKFVDITLHDELGERVGREKWELAVASVAEGLRAIEIQTGRLFDALHQMQEAGVNFSVLVNGHDTPDDQFLLFRNPKGIETIDVIPVATGSNSTFRTILGIVLIIVASYFTGGAAAAWFTSGAGAAGTSVGVIGTTGAMSVTTGTALAMAGASLIVGGIAEMLAPSVKQTDSPDRKESYIYSGAFNKVGAGSPIRVLYGEMYIGSHVINGALSLDTDSASTSIMLGGHLVDLSLINFQSVIPGWPAINYRPGIRFTSLPDSSYPVTVTYTFELGNITPSNNMEWRIYYRRQHSSADMAGVPYTQYTAPISASIPAHGHTFIEFFAMSMDDISLTHRRLISFTRYFRPKTWRVRLALPQLGEERLNTNQWYY